MSASPLPIVLDRAPPAATSPLGSVTVEQCAAWPTVLVTMPFMMVDRPSIQIGLLKAVAAAHRFPVRTLHANLDFAARIGLDDYTLLCDRRGQMVGDWLFSVEAFGEAAPDPHGRLLDDFADDLAYLIAPEGRVDATGTDATGVDVMGMGRERLLRIRSHDVPAYLDAMMQAFPWGDVRVVGFTSTFQQNAASFAMARRLKRRYPDIVTVFGGANFDGEMGLEQLRRLDCIDFVVTGEGDLAFPELLAALAVGDDPANVSGVARRVGTTVASTAPRPPLGRLDDLPAPDYDEYFERAEELGLQPRVGHRTVRIPFESARGCWWGAKHHCTFCGLNGLSMQFRAKSPQRVADELATLARRYRSFRFEAVDNIVDVGYLTGLLPELIATGTTYDIFYEVKANLTREQLRLLAQAGVMHLQPGLESLSTRVLRLMRKGVRAAQNVNVLRWGMYYGITVSWNIIWGFPGETKDDYDEQAAVIPHLVHLRPPVGAGRIWLERFSPLFTDSDSGVRTRIPERSYRYTYPAGFDFDEIAYFFEYEVADALPDSAYAGVRQAVESWKAAWERATPPVLKYWSAPGFLQIYDGRQEGAEGTYTFEGDLAEIYLACVERPTGAAAVRDRLARRLPVETIREAFDEFRARGLMFLDGSLALALALPAGPTR